MELESDDGGQRVKSVERAFDIVEVIRDAGTVRIDDVASTLDIPTSTAHVHLKTLQSAGYVVKDGDGYRLSFRFLRDGISVRQRSDVFEVAKVVVDELAKGTGEVANLGVEENGRRVILYQAEGEEAVYDNAPIGEYTNMHWTALGKAMLAHLPEDYVESIVDAHGLPDSTPNTITERGRLYDELASIREQSYAVEDEERRQGIRSVATPVVVEETIVGALSVSGPKERMDEERIQSDVYPALSNAVNIVELKYAYD